MKHPDPTPLALAIALAFAPTLYQHACAQGVVLPTRPNVVSGSASFARPNASRLDVNQASQNAIINWQTFSIGANGKVQFNQPNAQSIALNRVVGGEASSILGNLSANGRVFLVNPGGVLFGAGASVNVGGLVASTLNISDDNFNAGRYSFTRGANAPASVVNQGTLQAAPGGTIALLGSTVRNSGTITAPQGTAALASGKTVTLDFQGDGLSQLRVTEADVQALADNGGTIAADGGRVMMLADATQASGFVVNQSGIVRARSLESRNGSIVLGGGGGDVNITGSVDAQGGGSVEASGRNVGLLDRGRIDAGGGGRVALIATPATDGSGGVLAVAPDASVSVDGQGSTSGGRIDLTGQSVRAAGSFSARGGADGGDGGLIKLNVSEGIDTTGMRSDAGAPRGRPGMLNVDPFDVTIADDTTPAVPAPIVNLNPFTPVATSLVPTSIINAALNAGTNVTITTGTIGDGGQGGTINFGLPVPVVFGNSAYGTSMTITRSAGATPVTLRFDAAGGIASGSNATAVYSISSTAGPLNVDFDSNALAASGGAASGNAINLTRLTVASNGGDVRLFGRGDPAQPSSGARTIGAGGSVSGISLDNVAIDTRVGQTDASVGGALTLRGATGAGYYTIDVPAISVVNSTLRTATGALTLDGRIEPGATQASGLSIANSTLATTSGPISLIGLGASYTDPALGYVYASSGVNLSATRVSSDTGSIDIRGGLGLGAGSDPNNPVTSIGGVVLEGTSAVARSTVTSTSGLVTISGSTADAGPGVDIGSVYGGSVSGRNVVIRGGNGDPTSDAIVVEGGGNVSGGIVNLRPGAVDATTGTVSDRSDLPINVGINTAFGVGFGDLDAIVAGTLVIGSNAYNGRITVQPADGPIPIFVATNLTLQTGPTGSIAVNAPLNAGTHTIALATGGNITQAADSPVSAANLLLRANDATLTHPGNAAGTLAAVVGPTSLNYVNSQALTLGPVAASGIDAVSNTALALDASSLTGGTMLVHALAGNMTLNGNINAATLDLVTPGTFQNTGAGTISASNAWRLWSSTWTGELRGGLQGSQPTPNLYGCTYGTACALAIPATGGTFVYTQRPTLLVSADSLTRAYGDPNPALTFTATGLINGDLPGNAVTGTLATTALPTSTVGTYPITATGFASPVGYVITATTNGALGVAPRPLTLTAADATRLYGDVNGALTASANGLAPFDTPGSLGVGAATAATPASNAGNYPITPTTANAALAANYAITNVAGTLAITPATLTYDATPATRSVLQPNPPLGGSVSGLRNADTLATATSGTIAWTTPAAAGSAPGAYAIDGGGLSATNYVFAQAPGNASALTVTPPTAVERYVALALRDAAIGPIEARRDDKSTYVYDNNLGHPQMCVPDALLDTDPGARSAADLLAIEWSRLRSRPNVSSCFDTGRRNACGDF